jgi:hypothetical protein
MKKAVFIIAVALLVFGVAFAQKPDQTPQTVTIEGTVQLQNGQFAIASGNTVFYCPRIGRYVGSIDGLKEGSRITVEGYVSGNVLQPVKMTANGRPYVFLANNSGGYDCYGYGGGYGDCGACPYGGGYGASMRGRL